MQTVFQDCVHLVSTQCHAYSDKCFNYYAVINLIVVYFLYFQTSRVNWSDEFLTQTLSDRTVQW